MGVNVFQTANYYKLLAIRRFHMERDWFQLVLFPMLHRLNGSFHLKFSVLSSSECVDRYAA